MSINYYKMRFETFMSIYLKAIKNRISNSISNVWKTKENL